MKRVLSLHIEQLKAYQVKLPGLEVPSDPTIEDVPPWITNSTYMSPLLKAYEDRVKELEDQVKAYEADQTNIKKKVKELMEENANLREKLKFKMLALSDKSKDGAPPEECRDLEKRVRILSEQNALLREQETAWRAEKNQLVASVKQGRELEEAYHQLQAAQQSLSQRALRLQNETDEMHKEMNEIEQMRDTYKAKWTQLSEEQRVTTGELQNLKLKYETQKRALDKERDHSREDELKQNLASSIAKENAMRKKLKALQKGYKDLSESLSAMENVHHKLCANTEVDRLKKELKKRRLELENVKIESAKNQKALEYSRAETAQLREKYETETKELAESHRSAMKSICATFKAQENKLHEELQMLERSKSKTQIHEERALRIASGLEKENVALRTNATNSLNAVWEKLNQAVALNKELYLEKVVATEKAERLWKDIQRSTAEWKKEHNNWNKQEHERNKREDNKDVEILELREKYLIAKTSLEKTKEKLEKTDSQYKELQQHMKSVFEQTENKYQVDVGSLQEDLEASRSLHQKAEEKAKSLIDEHSKMSVQFRDENRNTVLEFSQCAREMKDENRKLRQRTQSLQSQIQTVLNQKNEAMCLVTQLQNEQTNLTATLNSKIKKCERIKEYQQSVELENVALAKQNKQLREQLVIAIERRKVRRMPVSYKKPA